MTTSPPVRGTWATRLGFLLASIGSAAGLGSMWRFSYLASESGGAAFLVLYLVLIAVLGIPLLTAEFVTGRMMQAAPLAGLKRVAGPAWTPLAWLFALGGVVIMSYYAVVTGWTLRYFVDGVRGVVPADTGGYFGSVASGGGAVAALVLVMAITTGIAGAGVKGGLERANRFILPLRFLILFALVIWAATLAGGGPGYAYYLKPDLAELTSARVIERATGQVFFSLSLGIGGMMTYASYLKSQENLAREAATTALATTGAAVVAGLIVFPVIFHFGLSDRIAESAIGALFIAIPAGFEQMGRAGDLITALFFVMLLFAALMSAISILEVVVAAVVDVAGWPRRRAAWTCGAAITLLGVPSALSADTLGAMDQIFGTFLLLVGGLGIAVLVGYRLGPQADAELARGLPHAGVRRAWLFLLRFVAPPLIVWVLWSSLSPTWAAIKTLLGVTN